MRQKKARVFIAPKADFAFRELLENTTVRIYLVSAITGIPVDKIKGIKVRNTFLRLEYFRQKRGVVDALLELKDGTRITVELQLHGAKDWEKRQLFYWGKVFTQDLIVGEHYEKLTKCISVAILDFNLTDRERGHEVYTLLNDRGERFSDLMEIHTIELRKTAGFSPELAEWIEFLNAKEDADLESLRIKTNNAGILEAINEVRRFGLIGNLRLLWEEYWKAKRDRYAEDAYVREEGIAIGKTEGIAIGRESGLAEGRASGLVEGEHVALAKLVRDGFLTREQALERCGLPAEEFDRLCEKLREEPRT